MLQSTRVNPSTGQIVEKFKVQKRTIPHSLCGYADWLYSRRNIVVHGGGTSEFLERDKIQIKKMYQCKVSTTSKISVASIRVAIQFYTDLFKLLRTNSEQVSELNSE